MIRSLAIVAALAAAALPTTPAHAAGVTTHAFMADKGREYVRTPALARLLDSQRGALLSGAAYPDSGYAVSSYPGGAYGETSHWERFVNAYVRQLRSKPGCVLSDPHGPCADEVAHLMGTAAHGVGDEMWDWMFEPYAPDHHESEEHPLGESGIPGAREVAGAPVIDNASTMEFAMDMVALVDYLRMPELPLYTPPVDDLVAVYESIREEDTSLRGYRVTRDGILAGHGVITAALALERAVAAEEYQRVKAQMPYMSAHMYDQSGGVVDVAQAAAGYYESLWRKLTGPVATHPAPEVVSVHPEPGERGVPFRWPSPNGLDLAGVASGLAENRVIAVLSNALPYPPSPLPTVPGGAFELYDEVTGLALTPAPGHPRAGPYGASDGTHSMLFYPGTDLVPCRWYRAVVTTAVRDHAGAALAAPYSWRFQTRSDASPAPAGCLDGPDPTGLPGAGVPNVMTPGPTVTDVLAQAPVTPLRSLTGVGVGVPRHHHARG